MVNFRIAACAAALLAALPVNVAAEPAEATPVSFVEDGKQVFLPGFFDRFAPQTAADMVRNLPGFQIRQADGKRGLGQGGTNVLIDGSRVSGKSTDPMDVLSRTGNGAVTRIEVVDGATLGISGLSGPVANVVLDQGQKSGTLKWNPQFRKGLASRVTNASLSLTGKWGETSYTFGLENDSFRNGAWGDELVTGPDDVLVERRYEQFQGTGENPEVSLSLKRKGADNQEANLNAKAALFSFEFEELSDRTPVDPAATPTIRRIADAEDEWNAEISGDYAFDAFGGRTKLIGFQYYEYSPFQSAARLTDTDGLVEANRFLRDVSEGETIARIEQSWPMGDGRSFELGGELVFNFNEAESALFELDADGMETQVSLDGANSRIEEERGEISAAYNFPLGEKVKVQASLVYEYSKLTQSGDLANERSFTRPKGFVTATYALSPTTELRGRIERRVDQLDFFAFASTISLTSENEQFGNAELVPEQSWLYELALEKTFADKSQITLTLQAEDIEDVVQTIPIMVVVPVSDGGGTRITEGVGNVDTAQRWKLEFTGTQMLEKFGVPGGQIEWDLTLRDSEIADPFSGQIRRLNFETKSNYRVEFRHDVPNTDYAYGIEIEDFRDARAFRSRETAHYSQSKPTVVAFAEHKDFFGLNAQLYVFNILNYREDFERDFFDGVRPYAPFVRREARSFAFDPIVGIDLTRTF